VSRPADASPGRSGASARARGAPGERRARPSGARTPLIIQPVHGRRGCSACSHAGQHVRPALLPVTAARKGASHRARAQGVRERRAERGAAAQPGGRVGPPRHGPRGPHHRDLRAARAHTRGAPAGAPPPARPARRRAGRGRSARAASAGALLCEAGLRCSRALALSAESRRGARANAAVMPLESPARSAGPRGLCRAALQRARPPSTAAGRRRAPALRNARARTPAPPSPPARARAYARTP
jgi:hypothetical protein